MSRRRQIYEGKAKILYEGPEPGTLIQYFKDDATAFNAQKRGTISGKGVLNNRISEHVFTLLANIGVPTHFIRRLNMREQLIRQVEIVPIEVVIRNVAAGSLAKRLGIEEGTQLPRTIIEYYYKDDALGDPLVSEEHIACFGWASQEEMHDIADMAIRVNDFMTGLFAGVGIRLVDFTLEFGRVWDNDYARIILADEISPDGCRLWDIKTNEKLDKDRFRQDLGGVEEAYQEVARRLGVTVEQVQRAANFISTLDPKPGQIFTPDPNSYVLPDVSVDKIGDDYAVSLNGDQVPHLRISKTYKDLMTTGTNGTAAHSAHTAERAMASSTAGVWSAAKFSG